MASYYTCVRKLFWLYRQTREQERYLTTCLPAMGIELSPAQFKRTLKYWQLGLNVICDNLYRLQEKRLSEMEYKRIILLSVFGPMFDDLFDEGVMDYEEIEALVATPEQFDRPVAAVYRELLKITPQRDTLIEHLKLVCYWQRESLKQLNRAILEEELHAITYKKSYYSVLLYCAVLDDYPSGKLLEALYPVAGLLQLTNDVFDVWKDLQQPVYTLPNLYRNFENLKAIFMEESRRVNELVGNAVTFHALPAMGYIALEQLEQVTAGVADLRSLSRKELVCDMDSVGQQLKWIRQVKRLSDL